MSLDVQLYTVPETAELLKVSRGTVYNLISAGELRAVHVATDKGRAKTRIRSDDLASFIDSRTAPAQRIA